MCLADLCNTLSPEAQEPHRSRQRVLVGHHSVGGLLLCYWLHCWVACAAYARTVCSSTIVWSGVRYTIRRGRISRMERRDESGEWYSRPHDESLADALRDAANQEAIRLKLRAAEPPDGG